MPAGILVSFDNIVRMRTLVEQFDELSAKFEEVPSCDPALRQMDETQTKITDFVRGLCNN